MPALQWRFVVGWKAYDSLCPGAVSAPSPQGRIAGTDVATREEFELPDRRPEQPAPAIPCSRSRVAGLCNVPERAAVQTRKSRSMVGALHVPGKIPYGFLLKGQRTGTWAINQRNKVVRSDWFIVVPYTFRV